MSTVSLLVNANSCMMGFGFRLMGRSVGSFLD